MILRRKKMINCVPSKQKNYYLEKDSIKRIKTQATNGEKILSSNIFNKGLPSRIYKELNDKKII